MRLLLYLFFLLLLGNQLVAQCPGTSPYWGLNCFLNSDFIMKFEETRSRAEQSVHDFKRLAVMEDFSEAERQQVRDAYNASANQFNEVLYRIKGDLLDRHKRKFLIRYPDDYALQIEAELNKASNFYAETYARTVTELTGGRVQTISFLTLLPELIKYGKMAIALFNKVKKEIKKYNESLFDQYLIEAHRFHSWDEIN
jgi:hypothetical protein